MNGKKSWLESFGIGIVVFVYDISLVLARIFIDEASVAHEAT